VAAVTVENQEVSAAWRNAIHLANKFEELQNPSIEKELRHPGTGHELYHPRFHLHYYCGPNFISFNMILSKSFTTKDAKP
jgi:hypothetical protein